MNTIWFGSSTTISLVVTALSPISRRSDLTYRLQTTMQVIEDLCTYKEYVAPLRQELEAWTRNFSKKLDELPLLDSFIKESTRTRSFEASKSKCRS